MYTTPTMNQTLPISQVRSQLPTLVDNADVLDQTTYITVKGKVKAAIVSAEELESMLATLEIMSDPEAIKSINEGLKDIEKGNLVDFEDVKKELKLK